MRKIILGFLLISISANAQYKNIKISDGSGRLGPCEPSIVVNPANQNNIVAGTILNLYFYSMDGGLTWESGELKSEYGVWGDPCVIADKEGNFYYFHLSDPTGKNWASPEILDRIVCQKSTDGGKTWSNGTYMGLNAPKQQDKEWAAVDYNNGNIYVAWTQFDKYNSKEEGDSTRILFSTSTDGAETWSEPVRISDRAGNCLDDDMTVEGAVPSVGPNGEVYIAWSFDDKIYFDMSTDHGKTWLPNDIEVANQPNGWAQNIPGINRCNGMPVTGCDISGGEHNGTIYINWTDQRNGDDDTDVFLSKSTDGGKTWTKPLLVNDDKYAAHQFFTWMSVDPITGYVYIVYYDRRNYDDERTDVYMAYSKDGGETFTNVKISESPFKPNKIVFFGDYNNISAYNGIIRPIWTRYENRKLSTWTAIINMNEDE